ncbi:hypothetical protein IGI04_039986 [Brassica rapa subsp. trilocularis]|uniref:Uncharacterized protein n=1 Tax=Brassica rapa subsp. trilocularis TaxID=1813537 RepID=A0ABQ7KLJ1_BRACM|nr:hypothetical protein IGI04_039986 [Brassica rapa subsp. trilocularis]
MQTNPFYPRQLTNDASVTYGEWLLKDCCWDFVVHNVKGAKMFFFSECSTHAELLAMVQEDYNLDMSTKYVEITYSLPVEMLLAPGTPPIHVTSDRQVRNLLEITKTHGVQLCVSSRSKVETVSEFREEDDEADECFEEDDDDLVEDENHDGEEDDGEEDDGEEDDGEEDADISILLKRTRMVRITMFMERLKMKMRKMMICVLKISKRLKEEDRMVTISMSTRVLLARMHCFQSCG